MSFFNREFPETAFGDLRVAEISPIFNGSFEYTVNNTELTTNTVTNSGTVTQSQAMALVGTGTTTGSTALLQSTKHAKYRAGLGSVMRFTTLFSTAVAGTDQYFGIMDETGSTAAFENGLAVGYNGTTFGFHRFANDTMTTVEQANFSEDTLDGSGPSGVTLDQTQLNVWFIRFQYLGAGAMELWYEDQNTGKVILVHQISYANQNTTPSSFNPNYYFTIWVDNGATTSDIVAKCASYGYFVEGFTQYKEIHQPQFSSGAQQVTGVTGTETAVFTIRNKSTYASKTNYIDLMLEDLTFAMDAGGSTVAQVRLIKDATLGGSPSYSDIDASDSIVEIDNAGTTVSGGKELITFFLAGSEDKDDRNLLPYTIMLKPGETITVSVVRTSGGGTITLDAALLWKELF